MLRTHSFLLNAMKRGMRRSALRKRSRAAVSPVAALVLEQRSLLSGLMSSLSTAGFASLNGLSYSPDGLTERSAEAPNRIALDFVADYHTQLGLTGDDVSGVVITDQYTDAHNGVTHVYLQQQYQGIDVFGAAGNVAIDRDGRILTVGNRFVANLADKTNPDAKLSAADAVRSAAADVGAAVTQSLNHLSSWAGASSSTVIGGGDFTRNDIPLQQVYHPAGDGGLRLAWNLNVNLNQSADWFDMVVDAETGKVLDKINWTTHDEARPAGRAGSGGESFASGGESFTGGGGENFTGGSTSDVGGGFYEVFAFPLESPSDGPRTIVSDPARANASPFGWHDTNGAAGAEFTTTQGNNVFAQEDRNGDNTGGFRPDGGAGLNFSGAGFEFDPTDSPVDYQPAAITNLFYWNNIIHDVFYQYGFTEAAGNFQENNYGNGGVAGDPVQADAQDNALGGSVNNANFATPPDGFDPRMQMYEWDLTTPRRDSDMDNGVIIHEYGHGISNRLTGGPANSGALQNDQSRGMGEGWSDFFALMLTQIGADTATTSRGIGTYVLGEPTTGAGIRPYPYTTDMAVNPFTFGDISSQAVPHGVGSVWATALWDLNWKMIDEYGYDPNRYSGSGGNNLTLQLVMDGLKLQPANPTFLEARDAILAADAANNGGANEAAIWEVFARRGMGYSAVAGSSASTTVTEAFDVPLPPSQEGTVELSAQLYAIGDTVGIEVRDLGLAGDSTVNVSLTGSGGDTETVVLNEIRPTVFAGTIATGAAFTSQNGVLELSSGDLITVTYQDADNGSGPAVVTETAVAVAVQTQVFPSTDVPKPINDNSTITSTLNVTGVTSDVFDVNVTLDITHTYNSDLTVFLDAPGGQRVQLFSGVGGSGDNFTNTTLDDEATVDIANGTAPFTGSFRPQESLTGFDGIDPNGTWTLSVRDDFDFDTGTLNSWSIAVGTADIDLTNLFLADFSNASGAPNLDGFTIDNTGAAVAGLWHLSTGRGSDAGHSTNDSMYFGQGETAAGGGTYDVGDTAGRITSPAIDLSDAILARMSFNYFLGTEGDATYDQATVLVSTDGGTTFTSLARNGGGGLIDPTSGWSSTTLNLDEYAGETVHLRFDFDTIDDFTNNFEGWYVDDVSVDILEAPGAESVPDIFFVATDAGQRELWKTDGTSGGTSLIRNLNGTASSNPGKSVAGTNGVSYFAATHNGQRELWKTDGTTAGTSMVRNLNGANSSAPLSLTWGDDALYFTAKVGSQRELWKTDGTSAGTVQVANLRGTASSNPGNLLWNNGELFFSATHANQRELWKSDGTAAGTTIVANFNGTNSSNPSQLVAVGSRVYFTAVIGNQRELFRTNGVTAGATLVKNLRGTFSSDPQSLTRATGSLLYFTAIHANQRELWKTDGTAAGTVQVTNLNGANGSNPAQLVAAGGGRMYFAASDGGQRELWRTDGTAATTVRVRDLNGTASGAPQSVMLAGNGLVYFSALTGTQRELWRTNGTNGGTVQVANLNGAGSGVPQNLVWQNGKLYFVARVGNQNELHVHQPAAGTTALVRNLNGGLNSQPQLLVAAPAPPAGAAFAAAPQSWNEWLKQNLPKSSGGR